MVVNILPGLWVSERKVEIVERLGLEEGWSKAKEGAYAIVGSRG